MSGVIQPGMSFANVELEVNHIEKEREADGNETQTIVNPGPNTMLRDKSVDIRIKVPLIAFAAARQHTNCGLHGA